MDDLRTDLRILRQHRGLTLQAVADRLGRSVGWLSQVERGLSAPEPEDVTELARIFDVPETLIATAPVGPIVRSRDRRPLAMRVPGLAEALLSPDLTDDFEVIHSTFAPGAARLDAVRRPTQELAFMISGRLDIWIDDQPHTIGPGDSARLKGEPFRWANPYPDPAIAVWVISPPVY